MKLNSFSLNCVSVLVGSAVSRLAASNSSILGTIGLTGLSPLDLVIH